jgi:hypothetical protein
MKVLFSVPVILLLASAQAHGFEQVKPEKRALENTVAELIKKLDDSKFETREEAKEALLKIGKAAIPQLKAVLADKPSLELATRASDILSSLVRVNKNQNARKSLEKLVNLDKGIDAPLKDALEFLSDRYNVSLFVDTQAFEALGCQKVEEQPVTLPKMVGVKLSLVLRDLLRQMKMDDAHGVYVIRDGNVTMTTTKHTQPREWVAEQRQFAPKVDVDFDETPLDDALAEVADVSGINIVLDSRVGKLALQQLSLNLEQAPADTAVRLLAEMANLRSVALDNVLFVTTIERAKIMEEDQAKLEPKKAKAEEKNGKSEDPQSPFGAPVQKKGEAR